MKLIVCPKCSDVISLNADIRRCFCGASWGHYKANGLTAVIGGKAIPLGFSNPSFLRALRDRPASGEGKVFEAFVIPKQCATIEVSET